MKEIIVYTTSFCGYCTTLQSVGLNKKVWNTKKSDCTKGMRWKNFRRLIPNSELHLKFSGDGENIGGFTDLIEWDPEDLQ